LIALSFARSLGNTNSICDRYSRALRISNVQLLNTVVNGTVLGLVAPNAPTRKYFDGRKPPGSLNFLDPRNVGALIRLKNSLVKFFYGPLGCTDRPILNYTGGSMKGAHAAMGITSDDFTFFVDTLLGVLSKAGVTAADVKTVKSVLESTRGDIVTAQSQSICDKYSKALGITNAQLLASVVSGTIKILVQAGAPTKKYFDGTKPAGSTNFLDAKNAALLASLSQSLINFFWTPLGCSLDQPPRTYVGGGMKAVHSGMGINNGEFTYFRDAVATVLTNSGVKPTDVAQVSAVVDTLRTAIVTA